MNIGLDDLLSDPPLPHMGGKLVWGASEDVLRYIEGTVQLGAQTLETGLGISTLLFALKSCKHTCITPSEQEVHLLRTYAEKKGISLDSVNFIIECSQNALPNLKFQGLSLVLIDGGHGFPIPAIDWFYSTPMLKIGGMVIIDDIQLWTGLELKRFLSEEKAWRLSGKFNRSVAFEKIDHDHALEWRFQPYIARKSRIPKMINLLESALSLLFKRKFNEFFQKSRSFLVKS